MTMRYRRRHRSGIVAAAAAFVIAVGAAVTSGLALAHQIEPAQHTVRVVSPPPPTHSVSEAEAAKSTACAAWDQAARITARASKASATALEAEPNSQAPGSAAALAEEKRTGMVAVLNLRVKLDPAAPQAVADPLKQWIAFSINEMHAMNQRNWDEAQRVQQQGNDLIDVIVDECGLR